MSGRSSETQSTQKPLRVSVNATNNPLYAMVLLIHCMPWFYFLPPTGDPEKIVRRREPAPRFVSNPQLWTERAQASMRNYMYAFDVASVVALVRDALPHVRSHPLSPHRRHAGRQQPHVEL